MAQRILAVASAIAVALAATWWLARQSNEPTLESVLAESSLPSTPFQPDDPSAAGSISRQQAAPGIETGQAAKRGKSASSFARRRAIYEAASGADERRLRALIGEARSLPNPIDRIVALDILLLRLLELAPKSAVALALESERADVPHLLATLASESPEPVWQALLLVGDPLARMQYQNAVVSAWALEDPQSAFASVVDLPDDWVRDQLMRQLTWSIARSQPQLALELANTRPGLERAELLEALTDQWSRQDPAAAAQWIEGLGPDMQGRLAYRVAAPYIAQQREEALAWALRISRSPGKNLWSYMIGQIAAGDPQDALTRALAVENPQQRRQALSEALTAIAARDPHLAISYIDKLPVGDVRNRVVARVASQIALAQPNDAIERLRDIDDPQTRRFAAMAMANQLAQSNPERTALLADRVPEDVKAVWLQEIAELYAVTDVQRGIQWVDKHAAEMPALRERFLQNVAMHSPDVAFDLVDRYRDDATGDQLLANLIAVVAHQAPETAARELSRVSSDRARAQAAAAIASAWAQHDRSNSRKWVLSLESGVVRDTALSQFISAGGSVDDALELIDRIQSTEVRMNAVFQTAARLGQSDPQGMRTLLRRHPLDPQRQQQVEQLVSRPR